MIGKKKKNQKSTDAENGSEPAVQKKKKKPLKIKVNWKKLAVSIFVGLCALIYYAGTRPLVITGTQFFGICRTYIELNVQYPSELRFIDLRERKKDGGIVVTTEYMTVDSYGQHLSHKGECTFKQNEKKQIYMKSYKLKRGVADREFIFEIEDPEKVKSFNKTVGFLRNTEIDLNVRGPARSLGGLSPAR